MVIGASLLAGLAFLWFRYRPARAKALLDRIRGITPSAGLAWACAAALVVLFAAQVYILIFQVWHENLPAWSWSQHLPVPVYNGQSGRHAYHRICSYAAFAIAVLQTGALAYLALAAERRLPRMWLAVGTAVAMFAAIALATPAMSTTDPYEFAASSIAGWASYAPPKGILDGTIYAPIAPHIQLRGVLYGPLWLAFDIAELGWIPTIIGKIVMLRVVNALLIVAFAALLARLRFSRAAVVACLANPAFWYYSVVNPHADIEGLVILALAAVALTAARPWVAVVLVAIAGCFKLPFVVAGGAIFASLDGATRRFGLWGSAIALSLVVTVLLAGPRYMLGFSGYVAHSGELTHESAVGLWIPFAVFAVGATAVLVTTGRGTPAVAWTFGQLGPLAAPWYLLWGVPFAWSVGALTLFALSFPLVMVSSEQTLDVTPLPAFVIAGCLLAWAVDEVRSRRASGRKLERGAPAS